MRFASAVRTPAGAVSVAAGLVAAAAVVMLPVNDGYYLRWINFDPQGDDQLFHWAKVTAYMTATSGLVCGQLVALVLGVVLAQRLRDVFRGLAVAVPAGVLLALVNVAIAWALSFPARQRFAQMRPEADRAGLPFIPDLVDDPGFHAVLGAGVVAVPLLAAAGVGLGTLIRRPSNAFGTVGIISLVATPLGGLTALGGTRPPELLVAAVALVPPSATLPAIVRTAVDAQGATFTTALLAGTGGWAGTLVLAGWLAQRRRRRLPAMR